MPEAPFGIGEAHTIGEYGFLRLERLTIRTPTGTATRTAVRHPGAVAVVAVRGDDVLLIRQYRAPVDKLLLELPAGKLDVAGEPPGETAARELEEEIGYRPRSLERVGEFFTTPGFSDERMILYLATDLEEGEITPHGPEEEHADVVAVPVDEIGHLLDSGAVEDGKTIVGLQWLLLHPA